MQLPEKIKDKDLLGKISPFVFVDKFNALIDYLKEKEKEECNDCRLLQYGHTGIIRGCKIHHPQEKEPTAPNAVKEKWNPSTKELLTLGAMYLILTQVDQMTISKEEAIGKINSLLDQ